MAALLNVEEHESEFRHECRCVGAKVIKRVHSRVESRVQQSAANLFYASDYESVKKGLAFHYERVLTSGCGGGHERKRFKASKRRLARVLVNLEAPPSKPGAAAASKRLWVKYLNLADSDKSFKWKALEGE